ncbi:MAG: DUF1992 domain-containing protein, partial [Candidatus Limnocylindrales bacterium]
MIRPRRSVERPLVRRDAEGRERTAASWESLTERLIREAVDAGAFADLPYRGRPLRLDEDRYAGDMALANHLLRNAGVAPPWIETDKEARRQLHALEALLRRARRSPPSAAERLERELDQVADAHDDAVARLEALAPSARQHRGRLDR